MGESEVGLPGKTDLWFPNNQLSGYNGKQASTEHCLLRKKWWAWGGESLFGANKNVRTVEALWELGVKREITYVAEQKEEIIHFFSLHNYLAVVKVKAKVRAKQCSQTAGQCVLHLGSEVPCGGRCSSGTPLWRKLGGSAVILVLFISENAHREPCLLGGPWELGRGLCLGRCRFVQGR